MVKNHQEILALLPYTKPFLFVDEIIEIDENGVKGSYTFHKNLDFYKGHFKDFPVTPGVILTETMAQIGLACLGIFLLRHQAGNLSIALTSSNIEFLKPVYPDEKVIVVSEKKYFRFNKLKCEVRMENEVGEIVCKGEIAGMLMRKTMDNRVVITGLGVVAPNGNNLTDFTHAIKKGLSGIKFDEELAALNFSCQISGKPNLPAERIQHYFTELELKNLDSTGILYGVIAGMDAWQDAGLALNDSEEPFYDYGAIFGTGTSGIDKFRKAIYKIDELQVKRLGSTVVSQTMASGIAAYLSGKIGLGNQVTTNSSACATGTESLLMAYEKIKAGQATCMISGSTSDSGPYIWGGFDAMKVCTYKHNNEPEKGSRPMSALASGFVPSSGAGALVVESLTHALQRGAKIYAEVLGGNVNSGGQRGLGTMTAPNPTAVQYCIKNAIKNAQIDANEIDLVSGHLTATTKDALEIENWANALNRSGKDFPYINGIKGMIGHTLSAAGSIECVAAVMQLHKNFIFPNVNCEDLNPDIEKLIDKSCVPTHLINQRVSIIAKANFGFGDVNACVILKKYDDE